MLINENGKLYVENKIQISKESLQHINNDFFKGYNGHIYKLNEKWKDKNINKCLIHLYPKCDTYEIDNIDNESGYDLCGYLDSLLFNVIIYDGDLMEYHMIGVKDNIQISKVKSQTRIFKDLSTMIYFKQPVYIQIYSQTIEIIPI